MWYIILQGCSGIYINGHIYNSPKFWKFLNCKGHIYRKNQCIFFTKTILSQRFSLKTKENFNKTQENVMKNIFSVQKRNFLAPQARKNGIFKGISRKRWSFFQCRGIYIILKISKIFGNVGAYIYIYMPLHPCNDNSSLTVFSSK